MKEMANPSGHVVIDEEVDCTTEEHYIVLEAELQAMRLCNEELVHNLQEQESIVATERLWVDHSSRVTDTRIL